MAHGRARLSSGGLEWTGRPAVDRSIRPWPKFHLKINFKETSYGGRSTPRETATHRPKAYPGRRNQRFTASTMPPCAVGVARQSPRAPYRTVGQPAALRKCMPVARRDGFHARSHSARAVKVEVRPGSSRHSNLITAKVSDPVPTSPATLNSRAPPGDRPALLSLPQAQLKRRLQRPASIGR